MSAPEKEKPGPIAWMVKNRVTPNILMLALILGGLYSTTRIKKEVFPEFDLDMVNVTVAYPGSSPAEVEQGIVLAIEEAIRGIDGIDEMNATAAEGVASVQAELSSDVDQQKVYQEIQQEVDRITTFPDDAEELQVNLATRRREVLSLDLSGDASEAVLREAVEQVRDRLLQSPEITQVDLHGDRDFEVSVAVSRETLRTYGLTIDDIASRIDATSVEVPGGKLETSGGEILLRVKQRSDWAREFARIPVVTTAEGSVVLLQDIATVREGFEDADRFATYDGQPAIGLDVYRVGDQTPTGVADAVRSVMAEVESDLPPGIRWSISHDMSEVYAQRLELLLRNAFFGLVLVLVVLGLFLEVRVAFWVTMGIPTSFLGALLFLPMVGVSINMISMFAFIVALGIVVDDAIIAGENIHEYRSRGMSFARAAILGARDVAMPITFSILTNVVAFLPLSMIPGVMGKVWKVIPIVVVTTFLISWVEALFILPAHLSHGGERSRGGITGALARAQGGFQRLVQRFIEGVYAPVLAFALRFRTATIAIGLGTLVLVGGYVASGRISMILMPRTESDVAVATTVLPYGSPLESVRAVETRLREALAEVRNENGGENLIEGVFSKIDENQIEMTAYLTDADVRPIGTSLVTRLWRERFGDVPGLESIRFQSDKGGPGSGKALSIELSHRDVATLEAASAALAERLAGFPTVKDIDDGFSAGKPQLDFRITPEGESLGLTATTVAKQVRDAFQGAEALRQQRGRNEVTVRVRLPASQRASENDVEELMVRTPAGRFVPLADVAEVTRGRADTTITRRDARRTVTVAADIEPIGETSRVKAEMEASILPGLIEDFPGLSFSYQGRQADMSESMGSLISGFVLAMLAIYVLLAIPFRSYVQPMVVMAAIPFGIVGAVLGHIVMGYSLSVMSMMGVVALSGVVVNDSLVLIDYANRRRREGASALEAIRAAGTRRFRPVLLTTLTTFGGLAPMIFETSMQAKFMVPMAISLGFGILFATVISLLLVPCLYMLTEDVLGVFRRGSNVLPVAADAS
jgi:multidrug efflux pump subunit AcrB